MLLNVLKLCETPVVTQRGAQGEKLYGQLSVYTKQAPLHPICKYRRLDLLLLFEGANLFLLLTTLQGRYQLVCLHECLCGAPALPLLY